MNRLFCIGLLLIASSQATMPVFASESVLERDVSMVDTGSMARNSGTWQHPDLPLAFEENRGQSESAARFLARGRGYQIRLAPDAVGLAVGHAGPTGEEDDVHCVRLRFVGARSDALGEGIAPLASTTNYFVGSPAAQQITDATNYSRVQFDSVYPGISLVYYGNQGNLEYDMVIHPGADPNRVRLAIDGADRIQVDTAGNLQMALGSATVGLKRPVVYQRYGGKRRPIRAWFERRGRNEIAIRTAGYDPKHTLIIDPILSYGTFLGGTREERGQGVAVDSSGSVYLTGYTSSSDFPILSAFQSSFGHPFTLAYVTKLNASGSAIIYSTYLGDTTRGGNTSGFGIAVDTSGNAYVTGTTSNGFSPSSGFSPTSGAYQTSCSASCSFVAKLGPAGNTLLYATFIQSASAAAIAIDASGNAYVTGTALSAFQTTSGAYQTSDKATAGTFSEGTNAFVLKLNSTGKAAVYSTFIGGSYNNGSLVADGDHGYGIAVDPAGNAYVGGSTLSSDFPVTTNAFQTTAGGAMDGFITKLNAQGSALVYSTRLGGNNNDNLTSIAVDGTGSAYVTGVTSSKNFPLTAAPIKSTIGSLGAGFVTKLTPDGSTLVYSSFLADTNMSAAIAVDNGGRAFVMGSISSLPGMSLPGDLMPGQPSGATGIYVAKISALGDAVLYATHVGWATDPLFAIAVDGNGDAYATGVAYLGDSLPFSFTDTFLLSSGAFQTTRSSGDTRNAIAVKLTTGAPLVASLSLTAATLTVGQSVTATSTVMYASGGSGSGLPGSVIFYDGASPLASAALSNGTASATFTLPVGIHSLLAVYRNSGAEAMSGSTYIVVNQPATCN